MKDFGGVILNNVFSRIGVCLLGDGDGDGDEEFMEKCLVDWMDGGMWNVEYLGR